MGERWEPWATHYAKYRILDGVTPVISILDALKMEGWVQLRDDVDLMDHACGAIGVMPTLSDRQYICTLPHGHKGDHKTGGTSWDAAFTIFQPPPRF